MDEVFLPTLTKYSLDKAERLTLRIAGDNFTRRFCKSCGLNERADIYSVRASSSADSKKKVDVWICDECAEKWAPTLYDEAEKKRAEGYAEQEAHEANGTTPKKSNDGGKNDE